MNWFPTTRAWALELTRRLSPTGTAGERDFPAALHGLLAQRTYFSAHPDHLRLERTHADPFERYVLLALVKGRGPQTVILTGHYDVVGVENYGDLAEWAADPEALLPRLIARLQHEADRPGGLAPTDRLALDDLLSGEFLPGRGLLDMKTGLAAGLAVLERFAAIPVEARAGNLLFIAVPDEETASHGARSAVRLLPALAAEWGLAFDAAINLDASDDPGDGSLGRAIYLGSVGKLLPAALIVGRETHAGSPFSGVNAALLAAELTRRIECSPALCDRLDGEWTVPPTCLKQTDAKTGYDVTTPVTAWCYYNWLTLQRPAGEVLAMFRDLAQDALEAAMAALRVSAREAARAAGRPAPALDWPARVFTYAELAALAVERGGATAQDHLDALERRLAADPALDTPEVCRRLTEAAWALAGQAGPAMVIEFGALYYPPVRLEPGSGRAARLGRILAEQAASVGQASAVGIGLRPFFPGISDISFLSSRATAQEMDLLAANTPAWRGRTAFDYAAAAALDLPVVNIGPWGRDYHQRLERVHTPYSFGVLPDLLWKIVLNVLNVENEPAP